MPVAFSRLTIFAGGALFALVLLSPPLLVSAPGAGDAEAQWLEEFEPEVRALVADDLPEPTPPLEVLEDLVLHGVDLVDLMLQPLTLPELRILRNTVYARHGRIFSDPALQAYFEAQSVEVGGWYKADLSYTDDRLKAEDHRNVAALLAQEGRPEDASWQQTIGLAKQAEEMVEVTSNLEVINAYLTDKEAVAEGEAPEGFEQPTLDYYKEHRVVDPLIKPEAEPER